MLQLGKKLYMLCPQHKCGLPMVFDPEFACYTERGIACPRCSRAIHDQRDIEYEVAASSFHKRMQDTFSAGSGEATLAKFKCAWCEKPIKTAAGIHLIGYSLFLCAKHGTKRNIYNFIRIRLEAKGLRAFPREDNDKWEKEVYESVMVWKQIQATAYSKMLVDSSKRDKKAIQRNERSRRAGRTR
jgi:hypothetical protein